MSSAASEVVTGAPESNDVAGEVQRAKLNRIMTPPQLSPNVPIEGGTLTVDFVRRMLTLRLDRRINCRLDQMCILSIPEPLIVEVPIASIRRDHLGSVIYRSALSSGNSIQVVDASRSVSGGVDAASPIAIRWETQAEFGAIAKGGVWVSRFGADRFETVTTPDPSPENPPNPF